MYVPCVDEKKSNLTHLLLSLLRIVSLSSLSLLSLPSLVSLSLSSLYSRSSLVSSSFLIPHSSFLKRDRLL
jgi:hypothetical protein